MHHEMDSVVHGHQVCKSVRSAVTGEQLILEKVNPYDEFALVCILRQRAIFQKIIHRSFGLLLHEGPLWSVILLGEGGKEKGLEVSCKYISYYGSTKDSAFI